MTTDPTIELPVNKRELARLLDCALPTLDNLIARYSDFPIEEKGSNGRSYTFSVTKVRAFIAAKRQQEEAAATERMALLNQAQAPLLAQVTKGDDTLSPGQQLQAIKGARELDKLGVERAQLVETGPLRAALVKTFQGINQFCNDLPLLVQRQHNLPGPVIAALRDTIRQAQRQWHEQLVNAIGADLAPPEPVLAAAE